MPPEQNEIGTFLRCYEREQRDVFENEVKRERGHVVALVLGKSRPLEGHLINSKSFENDRRYRGCLI